MIIIVVLPPMDDDNNRSVAPMDVDDSERESTNRIGNNHSAVRNKRKSSISETSIERLHNQLEKKRYMQTR